MAAHFCFTAEVQMVEWWWLTVATWVRGGDGGLSRVKKSMFGVVTWVKGGEGENARWLLEYWRSAGGCSRWEGWVVTVMVAAAVNVAESLTISDDGGQMVVGGYCWTGGGQREGEDDGGSPAKRSAAEGCGGGGIIDQEGEGERVE
ncbi:hypothetical protein L6452_42517 [Arctium lappa]|uniref:Uncharacterized protein n=1 Tax=Arctium lappa TaxID=4217 RepID=A0ACB8XIG5_ARCLA|nr:hypothetical protein L6452_42517 [Arctium lappa]